MSSVKLETNLKSDPSMYDYYVIKEKLEHLRPLLLEFSTLGKEIAPSLQELAGELHAHFQNITKAKIAGSSTAIVGGILATVGFGLSFVTFGASLGLTIAGGVIAGSGGLTVAGATLTNLILSKQTMAKALGSLKRYQELYVEISEEGLEIGVSLKSVSDCEFWQNFWTDIIFKSVQVAKHASWDLIAKTVYNSLRLSGYFADDAVATGAKVAGAAFRQAGTAAQALHIAGGVIGILAIPVDVYTLVISSIDEYKKNKNDTTKKIEGWAKEIEDCCPTEKEIEVMIEGTLTKLREQCISIIYVAQT